MPRNYQTPRSQKLSIPNLLWARLTMVADFKKQDAGKWAELELLASVERAEKEMQDNAYSIVCERAEASNKVAPYRWDFDKTQPKYNR